MNYYLLNIIGGLIAYPLCLLIIKRKCKVYKSTLNLVFLLLISISYALTIYFSFIPLNKGNLPFVTPISNVSPLLFSLCFISIFFKEKWKYIFDRFFVLFWIPMGIASVFTSTTCIFLKAQYYSFILTDEISHFLFSIYCYYLLSTKRINLNAKSFKYSCLFMAFIITIVLIININFKTAYFGLGVYGNHHIYGLMIFKNPFHSFTLFLFGLIFVLIFGYFIAKRKLKKCSKKTIE